MYSVDKDLLSSDQLIELNQYEKNIKYRYFKRDSNLNKIYRCSNNGPDWFINLIRKKYERDIEASYFLKYKKDAFTKAHRDAQHKTDLTLITFVSLPDLLGGESIVFECIEGTENYEVPVIVPNLKAGDGLLYTSKVKHAVGKVHSGARIVHVCWFRK